MLNLLKIKTVRDEGFTDYVRLVEYIPVYVNPDQITHVLKSLHGTTSIFVGGQEFRVFGHVEDVSTWLSDPDKYDQPWFEGSFSKGH